MKKTEKKNKENLNKKAIKSNSKGITLIALVITIIVMLILVVVTIQLANDGNLFNYAREARDLTQEQIAQEQTILNGLIDGKTVPEIIGGEVTPPGPQIITISLIVFPKTVI